MHIVWQHVQVSDGRLAFCDFDTAIAKSIFACPHDSTRKPEQAPQSVCVCSIFKEHISVGVCVHVCLCECVRIERVHVDKLQTPTLPERDRDMGGGPGLSSKDAGEKEVGVEGKVLHL